MYKILFTPLILSEKRPVPKAMFMLDEASSIFTVGLIGQTEKAKSERERERKR